MTVEEKLARYRRYRALMQPTIEGFRRVRGQIEARARAEAKANVDAFNLASARAAAEAGFTGGDRAMATMGHGNGDHPFGHTMPAWARQGG